MSVSDFFPTDFFFPPEDPTEGGVIGKDFAKTYQYDFDTGDFVETGGTVDIVEGSNWLAQSLEKELRTRRYTFLAYTHNYGVDLYDLADAGLGANHLAGASEANLQEFFDAHERVEFVEALSCTYDDMADTLQVQATVRDTFGESVSIDVTLDVS